MKCYLGKKMSEGPVNPVSVESSGEEFFPTLFLSELPEKLPNSGTMTIRFRVARNTDNVKEGKKSADVDVLEIVSVKADKESKSKFDEGGEALDKLRKEVEDEED